MNDTSDFPTLSDDHLESIQMDLLKLEFNKNSRSQAAELASLRDFNGQLLERIGQVRTRNLELEANEDALQERLTALEVERVDHERASEEKSIEITALKRQLEDRQKEFEASEAELRGQITKLSDENWALKLESDRVKPLETKNTELLEKIEEQDAALTSEAAKLSKAKFQIASLEDALRAGQKQLEAAHDAAAGALASAHEEHAKIADQFRVRESQLIGAFENLRTEYSSVDKCYRESVEAVAQLRAQIRAAEVDKERSLYEMQSRLQVEFQRQAEAFNSEINRLKRLLEVKNNQSDVDRTKLQTWREQLDYLDQHLRRFSDSLKKDRMEVQKIVRTLAVELDSARRHPFNEYLEAAETELAHLDKQIAAIPALSPARLKLEARMKQIAEYRESLKSQLASAEGRCAERSKIIQVISANLNGPV